MTPKYSITIQHPDGAQENWMVDAAAFDYADLLVAPDHQTMEPGHYPSIQVNAIRGYANMLLPDSESVATLDDLEALSRTVILAGDDEGPPDDEFMWAYHAAEVTDPLAFAVDVVVYGAYILLGWARKNEPEQIANEAFNVEEIGYNDDLHDDDDLGMLDDLFGSFLQ